MTTAQTISHYRILDKLGEGGMGVVYKAEDVLLNRIVALKFLHACDDLPRLLREARIAASLNHPHICTIYEVDPDGRFLAMELVEGESLSARIAGRPLRTEDALSLAMQIGEGLKAAHDKGVIHRDIKCGNILVTGQGQAKILDFGLARVAGQTALTLEGKVAGTPGYMAPEQARGEAVDKRTDIWALGAVLHEMLTGRIPVGQTESLPEQTSRVVRKALATDPKDRYQHVDDLLVDLRRFTAVSSRRPSLRWAWVAIGLALAAPGMWFGIPRLVDPERIELHFARLTDQAGEESYPSLHPDGHSFAYASRASGDSNIYLQRMGGSTTINLTQDSQADETQPSFSPDGERIAFRSERGGGGIFIMEATGESTRRLTDFGYNPAWSPDGGKIVVATASFTGAASRIYSGKGRLFLVDVSTGEHQELAGPQDALQPVWSPHSHRIAYWEGVQGRGNIWTIPAAGGTPVAVTDDAFLNWNPVWSPDGRYLYFSSNRGGSMNIWRVPVQERSGSVRGNAQPLTTPSTHSGYISLSRNGKRLLYIQRSSAANLQKVTFDATRETLVGPPVSITRGTGQNFAPEISPDGKWLAFQSFGSHEHILVVRPDGTGVRQLTSDTARDRFPHWSPDGRMITFYSNRSGQNQIWSVQPDGSSLRQLTFETRGNVLDHAWSPDGSRIAYRIPGDTFIMDVLKPWSAETIRRLAVQTGGDYFQPKSWSPDGHKLAGHRVTSETFAGIYVVDLDDPPKMRQISDYGYRPVWLSDSRRLLFIQPVEGGIGHSNGCRIMLIDTRTKIARELLFLPHNMFVVSISSDNRTIFFDVSAVEADVWLATLR